ncbi:MAG: winged helix-turn-helix domain-containing protein [Candidatus Bathyarchaeota archaeon]|nr:winged helix-turn-helix domain-containing protein [Candidatus Bathyarchaeota archaeon]
MAVEKVGDAKEEIYSTMFSSLKHPARRKILRILADKPLTFSEMLDILGVSSSNLTYHLENLGELVAKDDNGVYKLSTFGQAAVGTMKIVEEAPEVPPRRRTGLSLKWKTTLAILLIGMIVFASATAIQFGALNQATSERDSLQSKYNQLLAWSTSTNDVIRFLQDVVQIDTSKYEATLLSRTVQQREDLGGTVEEIMRYALTSSTSKMDLVLRFRNNQLSRYQIIMFEGSPIYAKAQPHSVLDAAKNLLGRLIEFEDTAYLEDMSEILSLVKNEQNIEIKEGNIKLTATFSGSNARILLMYTENNVDYSPKSLNLVFENRNLIELTDGWFLFKVGSTTVNISSDRALELATNALKGYSWTDDGQTVSNFNVLSEQTSVVFHPNTKNALELYPQWTVTFYLDKVYPGNVNSIKVQLWADTGDIAQIKTQNS